MIARPAWAPAAASRPRLLAQPAPAANSSMSSSRGARASPVRSSTTPDGACYPHHCVRSSTSSRRGP